MTGFSQPFIDVRTTDGRNFTVLSPFTFTAKAGKVYSVPTGATTDGASTPRALWRILPPFGAYWLAAVLHDYLYRYSDVPKDEADAVLMEAMECLGVLRLEADAIYDGVHIGGESSFKSDRAQSQTLATV